jgi:hypothetical protein
MTTLDNACSTDIPGRPSCKADGDESDSPQQPDLGAGHDVKFVGDAVHGWRRLHTTSVAVLKTFVSS